MAKTKAFQKVSGVPNLYHRSGRYYARVSENGKQTWRSLGTDKITVAKKELAKLQTGQEIGIKKRDEPTLHEAMAEALAFRQVRRSKPLSPDTLTFHAEILDCAKRLLPNKRLSQLTTKGILAAINGAESITQKGKPSKPLSLSRKKALRELVKQAYTLAINEGRTSKNPLAGMKGEPPAKKKRRLPNRNELNQLLKKVEEEFPKSGKAASLTIRLLAFSGMRKGEARGLTWDRVYDGKLHITEQENGKRLKTDNSVRDIEINPPLQDALDAIKAVYGESRPVMPLKCVRAHLKTACEAMKLPKLVNHDLRAWFATWAIQSGTDVSTLAGWLGDNPAVVLENYVSIMDGHKREAANKLR